MRGQPCVRLWRERVRTGGGGTRGGRPGLLCRRDAHGARAGPCSGCSAGRRGEGATEPGDFLNGGSGSVAEVLCRDPRRLKPREGVVRRTPTTMIPAARRPAALGFIYTAGAMNMLSQGVIIPVFPVL